MKHKENEEPFYIYASETVKLTLNSLELHPLIYLKTKASSFQCPITLLILLLNKRNNRKRLYPRKG